MSGIYSVDSNDLSCDLGTKRCAQQMLGHGGFVAHHEVPVSMGGAETGLKLTLCPNHHYRIHSLVRYLAECDRAGTTAAQEVTAAFSSRERKAAAAAISGWATAGRPAVGWPTPAAR
jgi:hypothetical protein